MTKIITRIKGGLGNQLFCYAAARRLAFVNDCDFAIDDKAGFKRDKKYNRKYALDHFSIPIRKATPFERLEPFERYRRGLKKIISRHRSYNQRDYIEQEGDDFDSRLLTVKPRGTLYLDGYWQSEQYFKDIEPIIRKDLSIIPPDDETNVALACQIQNSLAVAVHVRFFDNPLNNSITNASSEYYEKAILKINSFYPEAHFFIFSDQPVAARRLVLLPDNRVTLVSHNLGDDSAYADLWLMAQCQHFIIANSTFSWWGAWLASHAHKQIIAPGFVRDGIMSWGFKGLLPESWIKI